MHPFITTIAALIGALCRAIAHAAPIVAAPARPTWGGPERRWIMPPHADLPLLPGPVWSLVWYRLSRLQSRLSRLYARWQSNTLPKPRIRKATTRRDSAQTPPQRISEFPHPGTPLVDAPKRLPEGHGWVVKRIPEAGPSAGALHDLLQQPHTQDFVQAAPQAARLLRPLCRMLAVDQPLWLKLPPRPRRPRKPRPRPARPARPLPLTRPSLNLAPNIIRAVRYWRKKYGPD